MSDEHPAKRLNDSLQAFYMREGFESLTRRRQITSAELLPICEAYHEIEYPWSFIWCKFDGYEGPFHTVELGCRARTPWGEFQSRLSLNQYDTMLADHPQGPIELMLRRWSREIDYQLLERAKAAYKGTPK